MTKKLKIEYHKNICIGQGNCAAIAPDHFELTGKKATLLGSNKINGNIYSIEVDCDENKEKEIIEAGMACPVNAIRVIDAEKNEDIVSVKVKDEGVKERSRYF